MNFKFTSLPKEKHNFDEKENLITIIIKRTLMKCEKEFLKAVL